MKQITLLAALIVVISMMTYSAFLVGTLAHELTHISYSEQPRAVVINYDTFGYAEAQEFKEHRHEYAYLNGALITASTLTIGILSLIVIMRYKNE